MDIAGKRCHALKLNDQESYEVKVGGDSIKIRI